MLFPLEGCDAQSPLAGGYGFLDWSAEGGAFHCGVDLNAGNGGNADLGNAVVCPAAGTVRFINHWNGTTYGEGNHVWIEHDSGEWTHFDHLNSIAPTLISGSRLARGEQFATCGKSGFQPWAHLHFEVTRTKPGSFWQWPRGWSKAQVAAIYMDPLEWLQEQDDLAAGSAGGPTIEEEEDSNVIAELQAKNAELASTNSALSDQVQALRDEIGGLNSRVGALQEALGRVERPDVPPVDLTEIRAAVDRLQQLVAA